MKNIKPKKISAKAKITKIIKHKYYKQSRAYLKTIASLMGRDTECDSVRSFGYDSKIKPHTKRKLTKNVAIVGLLLFKLWQLNRDDSGGYTITNLSGVSRLLGMEPRMLKLCLIYLGGYQYSVARIKTIKSGENKKISYPFGMINFFISSSIFC